MAALGTISDAVRYHKDEQTASEVAQAAAISAVTTVFDKNLLQGASNFFQILRAPSPASQVNSLQRLTGSIVAGFTNPGLARWARSTFDADKNGMVDRLEQKTLEGWVYSMVPFSIGYNTPALNTLGEPLQQPWYAATTKRFNDFSNQKPHPIISPLVAAGMMLPNPSKNTSFRVFDKKTGEEITTKTLSFGDD
jgi:hypothetical protein